MPTGGFHPLESSSRQRGGLPPKSPLPNRGRGGHFRALFSKLAHGRGQGQAEPSLAIVKNRINGPPGWGKGVFLLGAGDGWCGEMDWEPATRDTITMPWPQGKYYRLVLRPGGRGGQSAAFGAGGFSAGAAPQGPRIAHVTSGYGGLRGPACAKGDREWFAAIEGSRDITRVGTMGRARRHISIRVRSQSRPQRGPANR